MPAFDLFRLPPLPRLQAIGPDAAAALLDRHARELKRIQVNPYASTDARGRAKKLPRVRSLLAAGNGRRYDMNAQLIVPRRMLRALLAGLADDAALVAANNAAGTFDPDEPLEWREGFADGVRFAIDAIGVELGESGGIA